MDNSKYYLLYRIDNGEWNSIFHRSFLTNTSVDKTYGQFISSSWFNIIIDGVNHIELMVVKSDPSVPFKHDSLCKQFRTGDTLPEFVVARECFAVDEIKQKLSQKLLGGVRPQLVHQEHRIQMGASFQAIRVGEAHVQHTLCCPTFVTSKN